MYQLKGNSDFLDFLWSGAFSLVLVNLAEILVFLHGRMRYPLDEHGTTSDIDSALRLCEICLGIIPAENRSEFRAANSE